MGDSVPIAGPTWTRRIALAGAAGLALLIISWLLWAHVAGTRLQAKLDEITARHEPIYVSDLDFSPIPDSQNAAFFYQSAAAAVSTTAVSPANSNLTYSRYPPYPQAWHQMENQAIAADQKAFTLARQARNLDHADWGLRSAYPLWRGVNINHLSAMRSLANALGDAALNAHLHNDDAQAIQLILDLLHLSKSVDQRGFLVDRLVAVGIEALAVERIDIIAIDLQVADHSHSPNAADRADVAKLIQQLLDEQTPIAHRRKTLSFERVIWLDKLFCTRDRSTVLRPLVNLWAVRAIDEGNSLLKAASQTNWPAADALLSAAPTYQRYVNTEFNETAMRRLAATSLALRLYVLDHGKFPADLMSLVGEYLPAVPDDPFYAQPHPVGYLPPSNSGVIRPLLYIDPAGWPLTSPPPALPTFGWNNPSNLRQWNDVSPWWMAPAPPTTLPTTR